MEENGKIYITISDEPLQEKKKSGSGDRIDIPKLDEPDNKFNGYLMHELMHFARSQATQMINYSIGNIGNFTGDYNAQRETTAMYQAFNQMKGLALTAYGGFVTAGVAGGVVGLGIAVASMGINLALQTHTAQVQLARTNYSIEQVRDLSGLNPTTNGNR